MEKTLLGEPEYARRITVVTGGYAPILTLPCPGGKVGSTNCSSSFKKLALV